MFKRLAVILTPFAVIARELTALRELYEADLSSRTPPVYRITEEPKQDDTEVLWGTDDTSKADKLRNLLQGLRPTPDEDEDEGIV